VSRLIRSALVAGAILLVGASPALAAQALYVAGTTDVQDSGLITGLIKPGFEKAYPQYTLNYISQGTGQAIATAEAGGASALIVHSPTQEAPFVQAGYSYEPTGRAVFFSDYVIIGPAADPAGVLTGAAHDAAHAFELIAQAGAAGKADFVSRGDASGTNTQEKKIWALTTGVSLNSKSEPGSGATANATWYHKANNGQAATVQIASQCPFPSGACYDITDRGTFNLLVKEGAVTNLKIVSDKNTATAKGGQFLMVNSFHAYIVNPAKFPAGTVNLAGAKAFADFLVSPAFQAELASFPSKAQPAFVADARPTVTLTHPLPSVIAAGSMLAIRGTVASVVPGAAPLAGAVVRLTRVNQPAGRAAAAPVAIAITRLNAIGGFSFTVPALRTGTYGVAVSAVGDLQSTTATFTKVTATAAVTLSSATATSARRIVVSGRFAPTGGHVNAAITIYGRLGRGRWQVLRMITPNRSGRYATRTGVLATGRWSVYVTYSDPLAVKSASSKHRFATVA
jgi:tungstate transport system substrate-binding protein